MKKFIFVLCSIFLISCSDLYSIRKEEERIKNLPARFIIKERINFGEMEFSIKDADICYILEDTKTKIKYLYYLPGSDNRSGVMFRYWEE